MLVEKKGWYVEQRAEQLAILHLSRRDDLVITRLQHDYGIDILIEVHQDNVPTGRMFGVQVRAQMSLQPVYQGLSGEDEVKLNDKIKFNIGQIQPIEDIPFPLCLFVFAMSDDTAYYRWIMQPAFDLDGIPQLLLNDTNTFKVLTKEALDDIVTQVNLWYEKRTRRGNTDASNNRRRKR